MTLPELLLTETADPAGSVEPRVKLLWQEVRERGPEDMLLCLQGVVEQPESEPADLQPAEAEKAEANESGEFSRAPFSQSR